MFYKRRIENLEAKVNNMVSEIVKLRKELKEKTTISSKLGGCISWFTVDVQVKDVVRDIVDKLGYRINHKTISEVNTYIEKKPKEKKKKVKK